jgi:hypothetical protein
MNLRPIFHGLWQWTKRNSTKLLAAGAITAEAMGFWFMHKEAPIVQKRLEELGPDAKWYEKIKVAGPVYLPAIGMLLLSTGCIVGGCAVGERKAAIMASLYSASEASLRRLEQKVVDEIGPEKAQELHDKAAEDLAKQNPPTSPKEVKLTGKGNFLCYEVMTGQWFRSDVPAIKNDAAIFKDYTMANIWADFNEWLDCLGIEKAEFGDYFGFNVDEPLLLKLSSELKTTDGEPYVIVDYVKKPVMCTGKRPMEFSRWEDGYPESTYR